MGKSSKRGIGGSMEAILSVDRQSLPRPINNQNPETERNESAPTGGAEHLGPAKERTYART